MNTREIDATHQFMSYVYSECPMTRERLHIAHLIIIILLQMYIHSRRCPLKFRTFCCTVLPKELLFNMFVQSAPRISRAIVICWKPSSKCTVAWHAYAQRLMQNSDYKCSLKPPSYVYVLRIYL